MKKIKNLIVVAVLLFSGFTANARVVGISSKAAPTRQTPSQSPVAPQKSIIPSVSAGSFKLSTFACQSASVLPVYTRNLKKYVILTREAMGSPLQYGGKRFTYDDFGGGCEKEDDDALVSAVREFYEEGNLKQSLGWTLDQTIKIVRDNILEIIVYQQEEDKNIPKTESEKKFGKTSIKNVTYIVNFDKYADKLFKNFYPALERERERLKKSGKKNIDKSVTLEKDKIAAFLWEDLEGAIAYHKIISGANPVKVRALVVDEKTKKFKEETVVLRPFFPIKFRSYFMHMPYETSREDSRIKYYR